MTSLLSLLAFTVQPSSIRDVTPPTMSSVDTPTSMTTPPTRISEWLTSVKLTDYIDLFSQEGFSTTDFVIGLTAEVCQCALCVCVRIPVMCSDVYYSDVIRMCTVCTVFFT